MKLIYEKGELSLKDKFLSPRLIKEIIEKKFTIRVIDETANYIKFTIIRFGRLYGFPYVWPQASVELWINNETDKLVYKFFWPEYFTLIIPFILFPFAPIPIKFILLLPFAILFFGFLMFLDTKWVSKRFLKALKS
jgi:hypothetical protein